MEILIYANFIMIGALWLGILIIGVYFYKQTRLNPTEEVENPILEILSGFSQSITDKIETVLYGDNTKQMITETSMAAIAHMINAKDTQSAIQDYLTTIIGDIMAESLPEFMKGIMPQLGIEPLTEAQLKTMDKKTDQALGALTVNAVGEMFPTGVGFALDKLWPEWTDEAQKRPREFMMMYQKAQQMGIFNMIDGFFGGNKPKQAITRSTGF